MRALFGIVPPDDRVGCLQDIHWYDGAFGYFPTYTLGAMTAAQLFDAAQRADPGILPGDRQGRFRAAAHLAARQCPWQGSRFPTAEIMTQATGSPLDATTYEQHLETRYIAA